MIVKTIGAFESLNSDLGKNEYFTNALLSEDSSLFKQAAWGSLKVYQVFHSENNNPLGFLVYVDTFYLAVYKFDFKSTPILTKDLLFETKSEDITTGMNYFTFPVSDFLTYKFETSLPKDIDQLHLTLYGDSLKYNTSDSLSTFQLLCKNISLHYGKNQSIQVLLTGREGPLGIIDPIPLELVFLTRGKSIYMVMLTPKVKSRNLSSGILKSILN